MKQHTKIILIVLVAAIALVLYLNFRSPRLTIDAVSNGSGVDFEIKRNGSRYAAGSIEHKPESVEQTVSTPFMSDGESEIYVHHLPGAIRMRAVNLKNNDHHFDVTVNI